MVHTKRQALIHESLLYLGHLVTADIHNGEIKETLCIYMKYLFVLSSLEVAMMVVV
jgi:hypothetical protein